MDTTPYWLQVALPAFPALDRDVDVDVAVVGAGLTGITTAYLLKQAGATVALLERGRCASADTGHTTAHLTYVTDARLHQVVRKFGEDCAKAFWEAGAVAIDQIHDIVRDLGIECDFKWVPGYLHAPLDGAAKDETERLRQDADLAAKLGFRAEFVEQCPAVNQPGVRFAHQAKFHPRKYLAAILPRIPGGGSHVFENSDAAEVLESPLRVRVGPHTVRCGYVIVATHSPIMGKAGLVRATLFQTKLALYTSYVVGARLLRAAGAEALFWDTADPYHYLRVDRHADHDFLIFGGKDAKTGQEPQAGPAFTQLEERLRRMFPSAEVTHRWLGQVVETNDGLPYIGEMVDRQFVTTGYSGNGFTLGTLAAMMARDYFKGRRNPWIELFEVSRRKLMGGAWRYITENVDYPYYLLRDRLAGAQADSPAEVGPGQGKIALVNGKKAAVYRDEAGRLTTLSPVCTHLGCLVRWNAADRTWDCPCHGSRFKATGEVFSGPAEDPLRKLGPD